jgi:hypothetical protein
MDKETYHRHAEGLLARLKNELAQAGIDVSKVGTSSQITQLALEHGHLQKQDGQLNRYDEMLSRFSSDLYNLMMNFAIRSLPEAFDQLALVLRSTPLENAPNGPAPIPATAPTVEASSRLATGAPPYTPGVGNASDPNAVAGVRTLSEKGGLAEARATAFPHISDEGRN